MSAWISSPVPAGGASSATIHHYQPQRPAGESTMDYPDDARSAERNNLRLALATFALQLDAFEMRTGRGAVGWVAIPVSAVTPHKLHCQLQQEEIVG
jgi:hypothetical protein